MTICSDEGSTPSTSTKLYSSTFTMSGVVKNNTEMLVKQASPYFLRYSILTLKSGLYPPGLSGQAKRKHPARDTLLRRLLFHFKHQLRKRRTADDAGQFVTVSDK